MLVIAVMFFMATAAQIGSAEVSCEYNYRCVKNYKCCLLTSATVISANNVTIGGLENSEIGGIAFHNNKKIQFLPVNVHKKFINLKYYMASDAAVKEISAVNFQRLFELRYLDLQNNQIEFIPNFCFDGLIMLNQILLGNKNFIK